MSYDEFSRLGGVSEKWRDPAKFAGPVMRPKPPEPVVEKEEGWQTWLADHGILDESMEEERAYRRYLLFKDVKFGIVPCSEWWKYFRDLVQFEESLVDGETIGYVGLAPFKFEVMDKTPFRQKPIAYPPK